MKTDFLSSASRTELCGVPLPPGQAGVRSPCQERAPVSAPPAPRFKHPVLGRLVPMLLGAGATAVALHVVQLHFMPQKVQPSPAMMMTVREGERPVIVFERMMDAEMGLLQKAHQSVPEFFLATGVLGRPDAEEQAAR